MKNLCIVLIAFTCVSQIVGQEAWASCELKGTEGDATIRGTVLFHQLSYDQLVTVTINVQGITVNPDAQHGIHIHAFGDLSDQSTNGLGVGSHWNYNNSLVHGCPEIDGIHRHNGDLGNWDVVGGNITQNKTLDLLNLSGIDSIIGRGLVLHGIVDPCTNGTVYGPRIATCVIGVQNTTSLGAVVNAAANTNQNTGAVCFLLPTAGNNVTGRIWFTQVGNITTVVGQFQGLVGVHGFHVHQFGDLRGNDGLASGVHWNPDNLNHGIPPFFPRHGGDMGNIYSYANDSSAWYSFDNDYLTLSGPKSIIGRTATIHVSPDICTSPVGGAGSRIGQCVVGLANPAYGPVPTVPVEISKTQNIATCQALYPTGNQTATQSGNQTTQVTQNVVGSSTQATNVAISLAPFALVILAVLFFSF